MNYFAKRLLDYRAQHHMSRKQLGDLCGVSATAILAYETKNVFPYDANAVNICSVIGMRMSTYRKYKAAYEGRTYIVADKPRTHRYTGGHGVINFNIYQ